VAYMPSHPSLVQGGHAHLVPLIEAAGGFLEVRIMHAVLAFEEPKMCGVQQTERPCAL
jgi:hypothetical protein